MLPEFFGEQRALPWQPNLGKNKPKFLFLYEILIILGVNGRVLESANSNIVSEFSRH